MSSIIHYTHCPLCGSAEIKEDLVARDHTVSGKTFTIAYCRSCSLRFTQDIPDERSISAYYQSEDYISHSDTSKGLINRLYLKVRKLTLKRKRKLVCKYTGMNTGRLLDVGSGTGAFANEMKHAGWEVQGLEPDEGARKMAVTLYQLELKGNESLFTLSPNTFDAITLWHVLEHVHELHRYMEQFAQLLTEKGRLFIAVPNYTAKDAQIYGANWAAYDVPRHLYHFSPEAMKKLVALHGMSIQAFIPMWYDSYYISMLSSKYRNGKTNYVSAGWNGLRSNLAALFNRKRCSSVIYVIEKTALRTTQATTSR